MVILYENTIMKLKLKTGQWHAFLCPQKNRIIHETQRAR